MATKRLAGRVGVLLAGAVLVAGVAGCSTVATRIQKQPAVYASLSERDKALVSHGKIREGMSKGAVYLAWGKPDDIFRASKAGQMLETWAYYQYQTLPYWGAGPWGLSPWGPYYGSFFWPSYTSCATVYRIASFRNEKVVAWASSLYP